jgi:hypothetical protein
LFRQVCFGKLVLESCFGLCALACLTKRLHVVVRLVV